MANIAVSKDTYCDLPGNERISMELPGEMIMNNEKAEEIMWLSSPLFERKEAASLPPPL
jgi:hypothetical protein